MSGRIFIHDCLGSEYSLGELEVAQMLRDYVPEEHDIAFDVIFHKINSMPEFAEASQVDKMCIAFVNCGNPDVIGTDKNQAGELFKKLLFEEPDEQLMRRCVDVLDSQKFLKAASYAYRDALKEGRIDLDAVGGAQTLDAYLARFGAFGRSYSGSVDVLAQSAIALNVRPPDVLQKVLVESIDNGKLVDALARDESRFNAGFHVDTHDDNVILYRNEFDYRKVDKLAGLAFALSEEADKFSPLNKERIDLEKYRAVKATLAEEAYGINQEFDDMQFSKVRRVGSMLVGTVTVDGRSERFMYNIPNNKLGFWDESLNEKPMLVVLAIRIKRAIEHFITGGWLQDTHNLNVGGGSVTISGSKLDSLIKQAQETAANPWETRKLFEKNYGYDDGFSHNSDDWDR